MKNRSLLLILVMISNFSYANQEHSNNVKPTEPSLIRLGYLDVGLANTLISEIALDYGLDFIGKIGRKATLRRFSSQDELIQSLKKNELDLIVSSMDIKHHLNEELPKVDALELQTAIYTNKNRSDVDKIEDLTWSCIENSIYCNYLEQSGVKKIVRTRSQHQSIDLVSTMNVDAFLGSYISVLQYVFESSNFKNKIILDHNFPKKYLSIIYNDSSPIVHDILDYLHQSNEESTLINVSFSDNVYLHLDVLVQKIKHFKKNKLTFSTTADHYPFAFKDFFTGEERGLLYDFLEMTSSVTTLNIIKKEAQDKSTSNINEILLDVDFMPLVNHGDVNELSFSKKIIYSEKYLFIDSGAKNLTKVAFISPTKLTLDVLNNEYEMYDFIYSDSLNDAVNKIEEGLVSHILISEDVLQDSHNMIKLSGLNISKDFDVINISVGFASSKEKEAIIKLFDHVFKLVETNTLDKLKASYDDILFFERVDKEQLKKSVLVSVVLILFILLYLVVRNYRSRVKFKKIRLEATGLRNILDSLPNMLLVKKVDSNSTIIMNKYFKEFTETCTYNKKICNNCIANKIHKDIPLQNGFYTETFRCRNKTFNVSEKIFSSLVDKTQYQIYSFDDITELKNKTEELKKAKEIIESDFNAQNTFLGTMTHELRTPLSAIYGLLELLSLKIQKDDLNQYINSAMTSTSNLNQIIGNILDFTKIKSGHLELVNEKGNILEHITSTIKLFESQAISKGLKYQVIWYPSEFFIIDCDFTRVNQILNNILSNAMKFTSNGGIYIEVKLQNDTVYISVEDTGIGMTDQQLKQALIPFKQANSSITRSYGGTGLGMSIINELVNSMHGKLQVNSVINEGTIVSFTIPVISYDANQYFKEKYNTKIDLALFKSEWRRDHKLNNAEMVDINMIQNIYPLDILESYIPNVEVSVCKLEDTIKVLIVEDDRIYQQLISSQMDEIGVEYFVCSNGIEASHHLINHSYDFIITDLHMPKMDGVTLIKKIKNDNLSDGAQIVLLSAEDRYKISNEVDDDVVTFKKPVSLSTLYSLLKEKHLSNKSDRSTRELSYYIDKLTNEEKENLIPVIISSFNEDIRLLKNGHEEEKKSVLHRLKGTLNFMKVNSIVDEVEFCEETVPLSFKRVNTVIESLNKLVKLCKEKYSN